MEKRITIGSRAFFSGMPDFQSKDTDTLILTDTPNGYNHYRQSSMSGQCSIEWALKPKADFLEYATREKAHGLEFGKFLVPEFASELGLTISDLTTLYAYFKDKIDKMHAYQHDIYNAYIENDAFTLTDEQVNKAYEAYKDARPDIYKKDEETTSEDIKEE